MRDGAIVFQFVAERIASYGEIELPIFLDEKDKPTFGARDAKCRLDQSHQHVIERASTVQLARYFEEERQLLQVGSFFFNLKSGDLAEQIARRAACLRGCPILENYEIAIVAAAELNAIVVDELVALDGRAVDEGAVLARKIEQIVLAAHLHDFGAIARRHRIGNDKILLSATADRKRECDQRNRLLLVPIDAQEDGEFLRCDQRVLRRRCLAGHGELDKPNTTFPSFGIRPSTIAGLNLHA